jgi:amino acid adenylation domain-containing protein
MDHYLRQNALRFSEKIAVRCLDNSMTYLELERYVSNLSHILINLGIGPGCRVAIHLEKSIDAVASIYAILRSGAAYVPLDPHSPVTRTKAILQNCTPQAIITRSTHRSIFQETTDNLLFVPEAVHLHQDISTLSAPLPVFPGDTPAYILFTSGSTGIPKGVVISRKAATAFLDWSYNEFQLGPEDRFANFAGFHFDISTFELFNAIRAGGTLHLIPGELIMLPAKLADYITTHAITIWYSVPWVITTMVKSGRLERYSEFPLRLMLFAGEVFPIEDLKSAVRVFKHARFYNLYGPTETNVCTFYQVPADAMPFTGPVPIGKPCSGDKAYILDDDIPVTSPGQEGELIISGDSLMDGYWNAPELTRQVIFRDLQGSDPGRYYRTGDRVRMLTDGNMEFMGRSDGMIKRRGFRIELGEIENAAVSHPLVTECAVVPVGSHDQMKIHLAVAPCSLSPLEMKTYLSSLLPLYMIPDTISFMPVLPRNQNGKIDRQKLRTL